eukprot:gene12190-25599_t
MSQLDFVGETEAEWKRREELFNLASQWNLWDSEVQGLLEPHLVAVNWLGREYSRPLVRVTENQTKLLLLGERLLPLISFPPQISQFFGVCSVVNEENIPLSNPLILIPACLPCVETGKEQSFFETFGLVLVIGAPYGGGIVSDLFVEGEVVFMDPVPKVVFFPKGLVALGAEAPSAGAAKRDRVIAGDGTLVASGSVSGEKGVSGTFQDVDDLWVRCQSKKDGLERVHRVQVLLRVLSVDKQHRQRLIPDLVFDVSRWLMGRGILGAWLPDDWTHLSVLDFGPIRNQWASEVWGRDEVSVEAIQFLKLGLEGLQQFWAFFWYEDFYDVLNPLVVALRDRSVEHVRDKYNVFLRARVERSIVDTHEALPKQSSAVPQSCPASSIRRGASPLSVSKFISLLRCVFGGIDLWEPGLHLKFFRVEASLIKRCLGGKSVAASPLRLAGGVRADGGSPSMSVAGRSKQCTSAHRSLREVTETEALSSLAFLSGVVRQRADTAVRSSRLRDSAAVGGLVVDGEGVRKRKRPPTEFFRESNLASRSQWASSGDSVGVSERGMVPIWCNLKDGRGQQHMFIMQSSHEAAGLGAYLKEDGVEGQWIGTYLGAAHCRSPSSDYQLEVGARRIDAQVLGVVQCLAAYINDPLDEQLENVEFVLKNSTVRAIFLCDVAAGTELGVAYGSEFWLDRAGALSLVRYLVPSNKESRMLRDDALMVNQTGVFGTPALHVDPVEEALELGVSRLGEIALGVDLAFYPSTSTVSVDCLWIAWLCVVPPLGSVDCRDLLCVWVSVASPQYSSADESARVARLKRQSIVRIGAQSAPTRSLAARMRGFDVDGWWDIGKGDVVSSSTVAVVAPGGMVEPAEGALSLSQSDDSQPTWFPGSSSGAAGRLADLQTMSSEVWIVLLVKRVYDYSSLAKNAEDATIARHQREFGEAGSCVVNRVKLQRLVTNPGRLNERRVREMVNPQCPDYYCIMEIARYGMPVLVDPEFWCNMGEGPAMSRVTSSVLPALQKILIEQYCLDGQGLL